MGEALFRPRALQDVHRLLEALAILLLRHVVAAELGRTIAAADADVQTPARDDIDQRRLLGQAQRVVERQDRRRQSDADAARARRGHRRQGRRVHREAVVDEVVLGQPDLVEAELLRPLHLLELAIDDFSG